MTPKFAWPFRSAPEDQESAQDQEQKYNEKLNHGYQTVRPLPQPPRAASKERKAIPAPIKLPSGSKPRARSHTDEQSQAQPPPILWTQVILRSIASTASIVAVVIAIYVSAGLIGRAWPVVFVSSLTALLLNTIEILSLLSPRLPASLSKLPRLHPLALIAADSLVLGLSIWSFVVLFLERGFQMPGNGVVIAHDAPTENDVELWLAAVVGFIHALLFVFDCIDCCSARSPNSRVNEVSYRKKRRGTSGVGDDVFEMDWG